jgi:rhodanese-related sulfurtransferase
MDPDVSTTTDVPVVTLNTLRARRSDPSLTILDVLSREVYAAGHIPGAINLPVSEIQSRASELLPDRNREIIVYCGGPT